MLKGIGHVIRAVRHKTGLSQPAFAEKLGDTLDRIKKIERGWTKPDVHFLARLRWVFRVSIDRLFDRLREGK